ncbi:MAG: acyl carrier protein [Defluviitaleaceae bacterium]|nr:acyl carrier protein [Defluviitaleaceae bacterium]
MVFEKVRGIIADQIGTPEDSITLQTSLLDDIGADSLDIFQIVSNLEEEFGIEFAKDAVEGMKTVGDAVAFIEASR